MLPVMVMNAKNVLIAIAVVVLLLAFVDPAVFAVPCLAVVLFTLYIGTRAAIRWWKQLPFVQHAQSVSQICRIEYFRRVSAPQVENWLRAGMTARGYVFLGDPFVNRSQDCGCAWKAGRRVGLFLQQERSLTESDFARLAELKKKCHVKSILVFSPFASAPACNRPGLEILAGQEFLSWMKILDGVRPVNIGAVVPQDCSCGAPREERVSRAGEPLLMCSRHPDCQEAPVPAPANMRAMAEHVSRPISFANAAPVEPPPFLL